MQPEFLDHNEIRRTFFQLELAEKQLWNNTPDTDLPAAEAVYDAVFRIGFAPENADLFTDAVGFALRAIHEGNVENNNRLETDPLSVIHPTVTKSLAPYISVLESHMTHPGRTDAIFELFDALYTHKPDTIRYIDEIYERNLELLVRAVISGSEIHAQCLASYIGIDDDRKHIVLKLLSDIGADRYNRGRIPAIQPLIENLAGYRVLDPDEVWTKTLAWYGIPRRLYERWHVYLKFVSSRKKHLIAMNAERIFELESIRPGASMRIYTHRGITQIGRYTLDTLLYIDDLIMYPSHFFPDELVIHAANAFDSDGALHQSHGSTEQLKKIVTDSSAYAADAEFTCIEFHSAISFLYQLKKLIDERKPKHITLIVDSHASRTRLSMNEMLPIGRNIFTHRTVQTFLRTYLAGATVIFDACSTGKRGGIAQWLSREGLLCFGPKSNAYIQQFQHFMTGTQIRIEPIYDEGSAACYLNGSAIR